MAETYTLLIQEIKGVTKIPGGLHGAPKVYVNVDLNGSYVCKTPDGEGTLCPRWNFTRNISAESPSANLALIVQHHGLFGDTLIGRCDTTIRELLEQTAALSLGIVRDGSVSGHIVLRLSRFSKQELHGSASHATHQLRADVEKIASTVDSRFTGVANATATAEVMADDFQPLLSKLLSQLEPIVDLGDEIAKIHPYINIAWKVLTSVYKVMEKQRNTDQEITKLVLAMVDLYSSVGDIDFLREKISSLERVVLEIAAQTVECSLFIREYTGHGFSGRLLRNTFSGTEKKIGDLSDVLVKLKDSFDRGAVIQSIFISAKISDQVQGLMESDLLKKLSPAQYDAALRDECLEGTRREILTEIVEWLSSGADARNIMWLYGVAGSGKSTIANTVSHYFRNLHRLGAFVFFDRDNPSNSHVRGVVHHIAHRIAESDIHVRKALCDALSADATLVDADYRTQFQKLLLDPLAAANPYICGPIVIIVDALDECLDSASRKALLSLTAGDMAKLPAAFRILITSRPDSDIVHALQLKSHVTPRQLDITTDDTKQDVLSYLRHCMQDLREEWTITEAGWPGEQNIQLLATYAEGLFIWAAAAYRFLRAFDPRNRLKQLLKTGEAIHNDLDQLYRVTLEHAGDWTDANFSSAALSVLALVVLSREALTDETMGLILGFEQEELKVAEVLQSLACVLQWGSGTPVCTLHASFSDYLMDPKRSGTEQWFIDINLQSQFLSIRCFRVLSSKLQFNICNIETSHLLNSDVSDLAGRVRQHIPDGLKYVACYWAHHLRAAASSPALLDGLTKFALHHFLYWLEVLSLLGHVNGAHEALETAQRYVQGKDDRLAAFLDDGTKFIAGFAVPIAQSMPHLYLSALPMAPQRSLIRQRYGGNSRHTMHYEAPFAGSWSSLLKALPGQGGIVTSVAFSHDSARIVSGSGDCTVRIWDAQTGAVDVGPLEGHTQPINSVAFSHDSSRVVSGSEDCTIRIWNSQNGAITAGPFEGHRDRISAVAFSHDSTRVVSGSGDCTVRIWDAQTGATVAGPFEGHSDWISSVAFSHDSTHIVSGSGDCTVRIWDTQTGAVVVGKVEAHGNWISSVAFSHDSTRVVSGSGDCTVRVWDAQTGAAVAGPFEGHSDCVYSVAFSHDSTRLVSGSGDCTVRLWDAQTGVALAEPLEGHSKPITSVAFSHDSSRVVSGSEDCTVRIWDSHTGLSRTGSIRSASPPNGRSDCIFTVAFSHDSTRIASGSGDCTVRIWDAQTGAAVAGPFKGHNGRVNSVAFSPDSTRLVSGSRDCTVRIWDAKTGAVQAGPFGGHTDWISSVAFSHDSTRVVSGSGDCTVRIRDAQTGAVVTGPFEGHSDAITSVAFSHDSTHVVSGSYDSTVRIWDAQTGTLVAGPFGGHSEWVSSVAFSHDSTRVVSGSGDCTVRIWDAHTGAVVSGPFEGHRVAISSVAFSHDSTQVVSGADDCTLRIWDSQTGVTVAGPFEGHNNYITSVAFSHDSTRVVSGSSDCTVRILLPNITWGPHPRFLDGWIRNSASDMILWVPPWLRDQTCLPWNSCVIGSRVCHLDWSQFVHGSEWMKCFTPPNW
ncbi:WD40 repeat-like protein [Favolaschia claudopus]|uniref:WD40 repeat-like protein n=1 Tax=Favolaschia claudopus TaxID=2862362 RepID=A0AAW0C9L0_9AGAR